MKMTIGKRVIFGFSALVLLGVGVGAFSYARLRTIRECTEDICTDCLPGEAVAGDIQLEVADTDRLTLRHLAAETKAEKDAVRAEVAKKREEVEKLFADYDKTINDDKDRELFTGLSTERDHYRTAMDETLKISDELKSKEAYDHYNKVTTPAFDKFLAAAKGLQDYDADNGAESGKTITTSVASTVRAVVAGNGAAAIFGAVVALLITRGVNKALGRVAATLGEGSEQVSAAAGQVSSSSQSLAQGATEQAASLEETSSSLEEMSSMTKRNAETAKQASVISQQAVVAEEVRNLAMRSAEAAKSTSSLIEGSVEAARNGVALSGEVAKQLTEIHQASEKVNTLISEIAAASQEQSQGIGQVNDAVGQMDKVTQSNAAAAEESAAAAEELSAQAEQLQIVVKELSSLVGIKTTSTTAARRRPVVQSRHSVNAAPATATAARAAKQIPLNDAEGSQDFSEFSKAA